MDGERRVVAKDTGFFVCLKWWKCSKVVVIVVHNYKYTKIHWFMHFNWVHSMVCELYSSKGVFKNTERFPVAFIKFPWMVTVVQYQNQEIYFVQSIDLTQTSCFTCTHLCVFCAVLLHIDSCNHHHNKIQNSIPSTQVSVVLPCYGHTHLLLPAFPHLLLPSPGPSSLATTDLLSISILFQECSINGIMQDVTFWGWLEYNSFEIHPSHNVHQLSIPVYCWIVFHGMNIPQFV